jgi:diacylglycerol kinase family enzyme
MRAILCHNPKSGDADHSKTELAALLNSAGIEYVYCNIKSDDFPRLLREPADLIIAAGGDGAVAGVVKSMPDRDVPLAILPLGTANNIARSFQITEATPDLVRSWDLNRSKALDVGIVAGSWGERPFVEAVGLGVLPQLIQRKKGNGEPTAKVGEGRDALREHVAEADAMDVTVSIDGTVITTDDILAIEVLNIAYTGPRLPLLEDPEKPRGTLGVAVIRRKERTAMMSWLNAPHSGRAPFAQYMGRRIELSWRAAPLRIDDAVVDLPPSPQRAVAEIDGRSVKVLVPPLRTVDAESIRG